MTVAAIRVSPTVADLFAPACRWRRVVYEISLVLAGTALLALSAQAAIVLPFSPVPVTGQTFAVLLIGAAFGARRGAATMIAYLLEGAAGLPVFAGWSGGALHLVGPTGGYLAGFVAAAWLVGALTEHGWDRRPVCTALAMTLGTATIFLSGLIWLSAFVPSDALLAMGCWPFLPGAVLKIVLAMGLVPVARRVLVQLAPHPRG